MTIPFIVATRLSGPERSAPLLVVGPSLGTSVEALWSDVANRLADAVTVVGWDLPGHGVSPAPGGPFTIEELAAGVLAAVDSVRPEAPCFTLAGDSVGGAVALQLSLDAPNRVEAAVLLCTAARIGSADAWKERADRVRASGTSAVIEQSTSRWFAPGFINQQPAVSSRLLHSLHDTDREGYAATCEALASWDVRERLSRVATPVFTVAGRHDAVTPPAVLDQIAVAVPRARSLVFEHVAHLAPAEAPVDVAALLDAVVADPVSALVDDRTLASVREAGMMVRRQVLGDAHVDRATDAADFFTGEFQEFISTYAWGSIWTRPGLARRDRSLITLTALVARGHHDELAMHVRAALRNGVTVEEVKELLLQTAIYCGVPDANAAFRVAQSVLAEGPAST